MNKFFLNLVLLPDALWRGLGADTHQLRAILDARLKLDDRRPISFGRSQQQKSSRYSILISMGISLVMGIFYLLPLVSFDDRLFGLTSYFTLFLFMLSFTLITDFSNVLTDSRDQYVLLPRPVSDRTLLLSRLLHIFIYLLRIVLPMALPAWIFLYLMDGWLVALWFPIPVMMMTLLALFLVNGVYLLLLRLARPARFKEVISYFQIFFSVLFFAFFYLFPRIADVEELAAFNLADYPWIRWFPSYWLAAGYAWLAPVRTLLPGTLWLSLLSVALPLAGMWVTARWLAPRFIRNLSGLESSDAASPARVKQTRSSWYRSLAARTNKSDTARAGFELAWLQTGRSRSFKMKVFPVFAYAPIYFIYMLLGRDGGFEASWAALGEKPTHLLLLYFCFFPLLQSVNYMTISDQYKAAWIYYASPVQTPGRLMSGAFKALWLKYFFPYYAVISIFVSWKWGLAGLADALLALVHITLFAMFILRISARHLPFSRMEQMEDNTGKFIKGLASMAIPFAFGMLHFLAIKMPWLKLLLFFLSSSLLWLVWDSYARTGWQELRGGKT